LDKQEEQIIPELELLSYKSECSLLHVYQWMILFTFMYNAVIKSHLEFSIINELIGDENP
jgi:hypothetical protein